MWGMQVLFDLNQNLPNMVRSVKLVWKYIPNEVQIEKKNHPF